MKEKIHGLLIVVVIGLISACTLAPVPTGLTGKGRTDAENILETSKASVKDCKYLGIVESSSILGSGYGLAGLRDAKEVAIFRASTLGATHIVWLDVMQDGNISVVGSAFSETIAVNGAAYLCEKKMPNITLEKEEKLNDFNYSSKQLGEKKSLSFVFDKKKAEEEMKAMPEKIQGFDLPNAEFSDENKDNFVPDKGIDIKTTNPFD